MANRYLEGLLSPGRRKSMQCIAARVGASEDQVEQFIRESPWEYEQLQDHLVKAMPDSIRDTRGAFIVDDVGIVKQGTHSVGVHRQYSGALGKIGNCQVAVNLTYASPGETRNADQFTYPLGMQLYLPLAWAEDEERREECEVPEEIAFRVVPESSVFPVV